MSECLGLHLALYMESHLVLLKALVWIIYLLTMQYIEITSLMIYLIEYRETVTAHGNHDGLIVGISLGQEYGTALGSSVIVVNVEVNMSKVELVIWVL